MLAGGGIAAFKGIVMIRHNPSLKSQYTYPPRDIEQGSQRGCNIRVSGGSQYTADGRHIILGKIAARFQYGKRLTEAGIKLHRQRDDMHHDMDRKQCYGCRDLKKRQRR